MTTTPTELRTPIDEYLDRQRDLSAVERFADHHDRSTGPLHERWYRDLLPASPPGPGQQYRFEVDMDRCTSCKSCVAACHSLNGLDPGESWRSVGVVVGGGPTDATQQTVTTACHHCLDPACLAGCPVDAYDKDPLTGIVRHLDDQCIGCSYCIWTCPYDVPRFNERLGIVRKCDMCSDRLTEGEAPACVQACPTGAIAIGVVDLETLAAAGPTAEPLVPGAPASALTVPSTRHHRAHPLPSSTAAADEWAEAPKHAHLPLVVMLVLTQLSVGTFVTLTSLASLVGGLPDASLRGGAVTAMVAGLVAIGASVGHLGRPLQAWRAVLGVGHSWLSREIVAFAGFAPCALVGAALRFAGPRSVAADLAGAIVSVVGLAAVACSIMIYAVTGRRFWRLDRVAAGFARTVVLGGLATSTLVMAVTVDDPRVLAGPVQAMAAGTAAVTASSLVAQLWLIRPSGTGDPVLDRSARLLRGPLAPTMRVAEALRGVGGIALPLLLVVVIGEPTPNLAAARTLAILSAVLLMRGELAQRILFFRAMASPRMPESPMSTLRRLLRRTQGSRTSELARTSGGFGLGQVPTRLAPDRTTSMICGFCSTGCSLDVHLAGGEAVNLTPTVEHPVNLGMACPKGWESLAPMAAPDRATTPLVRRERGAPLQSIGWDEAIATFVSRMKAVGAEHGPESVAFLSTGQLPSEEMALLGALARFGMGIRHGDGNTRQCMATAVAAYKESFGFDAPPYTYADFEASDVIVLVGSNLAITHPIMWERIARNPHDPEIVVLDPRRTETAVAATQHHALAPKSDLELLYGVAHLLLRWGAVDLEFVADHTSGFDAFAAHLADFPPERAARASGLSVEEVELLARTIAGGERVSFWWTMGVNQSHQGVRTAQAIIDLALMTGNIGRAGTGANSITGQCNAMGSRLFSNTTGLLGGHDFSDPEHRAEVAGVLGIDEGLIPHAGGWAYDQILEGIAAGAIRGLWVIATNTAHSWINSSEARQLLGRLDFLVVQDLYADTETADHADLVLPAAGWGEKEGTFINSERRLGLLKQVRRAPGQALADFWIFKLIAEAWGCGELFRAWETPEATFRLLARLTAGRPCDITGVDGFDQIDRARGIQWPHPAGEPAPAPERRLFADGRFFTEDRRARFVFDEPRPVPEPTDDDYPLVLLTGRGSTSQWHTQTRTRRSEILRDLAPESLLVELAPDDAAAAGVRAGQTVAVESRRGSIRAIAQPVPTMPSGQIFLPMHDEATNLLTFPRVDPHSRQPAYKHAAVRVRPLHYWER